MDISNVKNQYDISIAFRKSWKELTERLKMETGKFDQSIHIYPINIKEKDNGE